MSAMSCPERPPTVPRMTPEQGGIPLREPTMEGYSQDSLPVGSGGTCSQMSPPSFFDSPICLAWSSLFIWLMLAAAVGFIYSRDSELVVRPGKRSLSGVQPSPLYIIPLILFLCFSLDTLIGVHKHTRAHPYTCVHTLACSL